jgi:hypothetical protein
MDAREAADSEAAQEAKRQDWEKRRAPPTDECATQAQLKFIEDLGGTIPINARKHEASELIGRLLAEREASESVTTTPTRSLKKDGDSKLRDMLASHRIKPGQTTFDVCLPARQPYEGKATLKQRDLIWHLGFRDQAVIDSLGKWQASALIDQIKTHKKQGGSSVILFLIVIVFAAVIFVRWLS